MTNAQCNNQDVRGEHRGDAAWYESGALQAQKNGFPHFPFVECVTHGPLFIRYGRLRVGMCASKGPRRSHIGSIGAMRSLVGRSSRADIPEATRGNEWPGGGGG